MDGNRRDLIESHAGITIATIIESKERRWGIENPDRFSMDTTESFTPPTSTSMSSSSNLSDHTPDPESYERGRPEFGGDDAIASRYYPY